MVLADDGNYRETRFFATWDKDRGVEEFVLPTIMHDIQKISKFGFGLLWCNDTTIGQEICEEMWAPESPSYLMVNEGAEIISNSSGSHHTLRKLFKRLHLIKNTTSKLGGIYIYSNHQGCDGNRLYFDGCSLISMNGELYVQGS